MKHFTFLGIILMILGCDAVVDDKSSFDYSIEQKLGCFCPLGGVWTKLYVRADTIADAVFLADNSQLTFEERSQYRTINALLRDISQIDTTRYSVIVTIDTIHNFPSYFNFNPKPIVNGDTAGIVVDAQVSYTTRNYFDLR
jgi:hypothetical protein